MTRKAPTLSELLGDPVIQSMMESDGVEPDEIRRLFEALMNPRPPRANSVKETCSPFAYALRGFVRR
jgi:hypothetical protein